MLVQANSTTFITNRSDAFWEELGVFPSALRRQEGPDGELKAFSRMKVRLAKCPTANIRLLCTRALQQPPPKDLTQDQLVSLFIDLCNKESLACLGEFLRRKGECVNDEFDLVFSEGDRRKLQTLLRDFGASRGKLRQLTKLLLLCSTAPNCLRRIYRRSIWRSRPTAETLISSGPINDTAIESIETSIDSLAVELSKLAEGRTVRFKAREKIEDGLLVLLLERENAPSLTADFHQVFAAFTTFGWIMIGFRDHPAKIEIKAGDKRVVECISNWLTRRADLSLPATADHLFSDYDPVEVEAKLLGEFSDESPLDLIGIGFRRSLGPCHAPMTLESSFEGQSIRRDLMWLKEREAVRVRSLADLKFLKIRREDKTFVIQVEIHESGIARFRLDDTGLNSKECEDVAAEFRTQFGIPLGSAIDPTKLPMGTVDVINNLLETDRLDMVSPFQGKTLERLLKMGVLKTRDETIRQCSSSFCQKVIDDTAADECPKCGSNLKNVTVKYLDQDRKAIIKATSKILKEASGWKLRSTPSSFEEHEMYPLLEPTAPIHQVEVHFASRVNPSLLKLIDRSMLPVLVVHTGGNVETAHLDVAGVAHLGLGYALAASEDDITKKRFNDDLTVAITGVFQRKQERVFRAARQSRSVLDQIPTKYPGTSYEQDVFNLIRSLCPHVERWGGGSRPDGFCSIVYVANGRLRDVQKHNWSYDSKLSDKDEGYDLNAGEKRKMFDYVEALLTQPWLQVQGNTLNGHVIITNRVSDAVMKSCAEFLRRDHRLGTEHPEVKLVFMLQDFLVSLYDGVRANEDAVYRRRNWLGSRIAYVMKEQGSNGYVYLDKNKADELIAWVLEQPEIETPVDIDKLKCGLDETMRGS